MRAGDVFARARSALAGRPRRRMPSVLPRSADAPPVAFLVSLARPQGDLVVPLHAGENFVGRELADGSRFGEWPEPPVVERSQWFIECDFHGADVWDADSRHHSVLVPCSIAGGIELGGGLDGLYELFAVPGIVPLRRANDPTGCYRHPLDDGDVLRSCYQAFAFGWIEPRKSKRFASLPRAIVRAPR